MSSDIAQRPPVILLPLRPASLTHKNPQRCKKIHGMHPIAYKDQSINVFLQKYPVRVISVAIIILMAVV